MFSDDYLSENSNSFRHEYIDDSSPSYSDNMDFMFDHFQIADVLNIKEKKDKPCRKYVKGECNTILCPYLHDEIQKLDFIKKRGCSSFKACGQCIFKENCINVSFHKQCDFHIKGRCRKGEACHFYHDPKFNQLPRIPPFQKKCSFFEKGFCLKGEFCPFYHEKENIKVNNDKTNNQEDKLLCSICLMKKADHAALPCGHLNYCDECSYNLKKCAICRKDVEKMQKIFLG